MQPAADAKGIDAARRSSIRRWPDDAGDRDRLQQVVWNLLSNAIKFTPRGGRVEVRLRPRSRTSGSPSATPAAASIPSSCRTSSIGSARPTRARRARHGGLGLGLAIVGHLVELHGGRVEAQAKGAGAGRHVHGHSAHVVRTRGQAAAGAATDAHEPFASASRVRRADRGRRRRDARAARRNHSSDRGDLRSAREYSEAFARSQRMPPDLIVADVGMPHEDGCSLLRRIHAQPATAHTPAIALSAYTRPEDRTAALAGRIQPVHREAGRATRGLAVAVELAQDRHQHS